jgi:hypothetical protein
MQTVYTVAMVLGFKNALEHSYRLFLSPLDAPRGALSHGALLGALAAIMLLGLRFFWVIRNLYAYVLKPMKDGSKPTKANVQRRMSVMTAVHFPITLLHALLFFSICEAYVDLVTSKPKLAPGLAATLSGRFVFLFAGLLLLNGIWLVCTFGLDRNRAEGRWALSNIGFALLAGIDALLVLEVFRGSPDVLVVSACILFLVNGGLDLRMASSSYIEFPEGDKPVVCCVDRDPDRLQQLIRPLLP